MKEVFTDMDSKDIKSEYLNGVYNEISVLLGIEAALHSAFRIPRPADQFSGKLFLKRIHIKPDCGGV